MWFQDDQCLSLRSSGALLCILLQGALLVLQNMFAKVRKILHKSKSWSLSNGPFQML